MLNIDLLKEEFKNSKVEFGKEIFDKLSSKTNDGKIFPPYIPFIGKNYEEFRVLIYSTSQNIKYNSYRNLYSENYSKLIERLYYFHDFRKKYPFDKMSFKDIAINPYKTGVLAALLGVFIYSKFCVKIKDLDEINNMIGISNYYKFSLNNGKVDINPETKIKSFIEDESQIEDYWERNDKLVKKELEALKPSYIISFKGRKLEKLRKFVDKDCKIVKINDPSWILQGGSGVFKENKSWWKKSEKYKNKEIEELVDTYLEFIVGNYKAKKDYIKIYLLKYYSDWLNEK